MAERCKRRVMLTGTPLQNDLEELQNLLRFLMPKLFTDAEASDIQKIRVSQHPEIQATLICDCPIAQGSMSQRWCVCRQEEEEVSRLAERMQALLRPFVLRRLKTEVANQLVPKRHIVHQVAMTAEQGRLYAEAVADLRATTQPAGEHGCAPAHAWSTVRT